MNHPLNTGFAELQGSLSIHVFDQGLHMSRQKWEEVLTQSLEDLTMSRGEKAVFKHSIAEACVDAHESNLIRNRAFQMAREKLTDPTAKSVLGWLEKVVTTLAHERQKSGDATSEAWFSPKANCVSRINELIRGARKQIEICVFTITDDRISDCIVDAHARGIQVKVISDDDKATDLGSDVYNLKARGVPVRTDSVPDHMHHKYAIFDRRLLLTGSYNWTRSASKVNEDNFIVTDDASLLQQFGRHFDQLWDEFARD